MPKKTRIINDFKTIVNKEIRIQFIEQFHEGNKICSGWKVIEGNKNSGILSYEEMLGVVISLSLPNNRPCIHWMKTEEQHIAEQEQRLRKS
jgi:hypothetical protein